MVGGTIIDPLADDDRAGWAGPERVPPAPGHSDVPYAELHCHTNFSFLDGASHPEELAHEAVRLGLKALAITDHDGLYGVVRFAEAARELPLQTVFGAELGLSGVERAGPPDPAGEHLLLLAKGQTGYARLSSVIARAHLAGGQKGRPRYDLDAIAGLHGHVVALTGCRKGAVPQALARNEDAARRLDELTEMFGRDNVFVELTDHGDPLDGDRNDALVKLARAKGLELVATNNVHYHAPSRRRLATVMAAVRARSSLDQIDPYLPAAATAHLRSGDEMAARLFSAEPVVNAARLAERLAFDLHLIAPELPPFKDLKPGQSEMDLLRDLVYRGAAERYGLVHSEAYAQIERELKMIDELNFPGYFLVVWDIVRFCRDNGILCQGRGSAANSAVCYAIGVTNVDPIAYKLLFERFLAPERDGPPDIDVDIESDRREEVIQYVYETHGRERTALVANVISYRPRSAVRDVARAFGHSPGQQDAWSKQIDRWRAISKEDIDGVPGNVLHFANELLTAPRHLGIHSGGMVICDRPIIEVCPVEWARMEGRTVLQWDKDDCAAIKLVKFDLLGLGMLSAIQYAYEFLGMRADLSQNQPHDPEIYEMLCRADTVGVFQVESRAQMSTLPRLQPREFYDIVVEVALIRPGPIQGGSVHPFIRRKNGEEWEIPHPLMMNALGRTKGVPLFQEQMMQLAMDVADFTPEDADKLRRAMGSKRSLERMAELKDKLFAGMAKNGITGELADDIYNKLAAFSHYGFPESHAISFAHLVYVSAWLKRYHPAAFCASLLKAQPMGFYSPQSLVDDARRHGVEVLRPDINRSEVKATLEGGNWAVRADGPGTPPSQWGLGGPSVRLGLDTVRTISESTAKLIVERRPEAGYVDIPDVVVRTRLPAAQLEALATANAFACFGLDRREALWIAGAAAQERSGHLPGTTVGLDAPALPGMEDVDLLVSDVWSTGLSPDSHPIKLVRPFLDEQRAVPISRLPRIEHRSRVAVGGLVTHRQRPATASGITFINLEDETGMLNVVCSPGLWQRYRRLAITSPALIVRGTLESQSGVINLVAEKLTRLPISTNPKSRDFR
ncbi:error-prone DNA polymerase [Allorhizocola rhizosphaerae]|uniref:error-prone DNA polymerase n=1 Tax=Allorhizocola rhizosphaerae TaxID=1872709 RepID=UPI000E3C6624